MSDWTDEVEARLSRAGGVYINSYGSVESSDIRAALEEIRRLTEIKEYAERTHEEMRVEIERWREALSFAEGCIPAQIMLALRLSGMPESRATVGEIAAWLRAALRGGGERCLCDDDSPNHCAKCTRELLRGGGK